jgi:elongation factor Ts
MSTMAKDITAKMVADLRAKTGAGMMDCKKALEEAGGDMAKAEEIVRVKYAAKAEKRSGRKAGEGAIGTYQHFDGKKAAVVVLNCETDFVARTDEFKELAKDIAMHVVATRPIALSIEDLPAETVEREKRIYEQQVAEEKKPDAVKVKMIEGRLRKFYEENVLLEQKFAKDDKVTVGEMVKRVAGKTGENVRVTRFGYFDVGGE